MSSMARDPGPTIETIKRAVRADGKDNENRIKRSIVKMKKLNTIYSYSLPP
jgi:hypothetical protein